MKQVIFHLYLKFFHTSHVHIHVYSDQYNEVMRLATEICTGITRCSDYSADKFQKP